jgi:hypothetical protein
MTRKTAGVELLVRDVMMTIREPYGEDVILDVCLAIENNPEWMRRYRGLGGELRLWVVNNWIGQYTKSITGMRSLKEVDTKRSSIIGSYTKLVA